VLSDVELVVNLSKFSESNLAKDMLVGVLFNDMSITLLLENEYCKSD
jgi:hypothetical protein